MKKKIFYLFSDTGGGHRSAATSLMRAVEELEGKNAPLQEMVDVFSECSKFLNLFAKLYGPVIKYSPKMWGVLYYWLNDLKKLQNLEKIARPFIVKELAALLSKRKPDVVVSVHPMLNHITVAAMRQAGRVVPMITVITDPVSIHAAWVCPEVDLIIVATEKAKELAVKYGAPPSKVKLIGLPIDPKFSRPSKEKGRLRSDLGLFPKLFTVLMMGGGEGGGSIYETAAALNHSKVQAQLIIVAGRNEKLKRRLEKAAPKFRMPMKVYGFTNEVPDLMSASDIIITKAGPGSIAEALAKELPLIITSWLPGQEEGNVEFVLKEGLGVVAKDHRKISKVVTSISRPQTYARYLKNIRRASDPKAGFKIAKTILSFLR
ncbi:MAG: glycosyltransferase [Candidatus Margulisiibacteriota bacterium]